MSDAIVAPASLLLATDLSARAATAPSSAPCNWHGNGKPAWSWRRCCPSMQELDFHDPIFGTPPWERPALLSQVVEKRLRREFAVDDVDIQVQVETGAVGPALLRVAPAHGCGLVITGIARNALFTQPTLGSSVTWLSRHTTLPLLVVHRRAQGRTAAWHGPAISPTPPRAPCSWRWRCSARRSRWVRCMLFHVARLGQRDAHAAAALAQARQRAQAALERAIDTLALPTDLRGRLEAIVAEAEPSRLLRDYVRDHDVELAVLGGHGRSALSGLLLGDVAGRILHSVQTDTLFVRDRGDAALDKRHAKPNQSFIPAQ